MSNLVVREHSLLHGLRDPILITAFSSLQKGGATAPAALGYALEQLEARPIAEIDAMDCYNFARMRPWVRREGDRTVVDWPRNVVYRYEAPEQTVLALIGVEPTLNWPDFIGAISEFAQRAGVDTAVNLKAAGAVVPHTAPAPVRAIYSEPGLVSEFGIQELEETDGPGDIGRILNLQAVVLPMSSLASPSTLRQHRTVPPVSPSCRLLSALSVWTSTRSAWRRRAKFNARPSIWRLSSLSSCAKRCRP